MERYIFVLAIAVKKTQIKQIETMMNYLKTRFINGN